MNRKMNIEECVCPGKVYYTKIDGCCPSSVSLSNVWFTYRWFRGQDKEYVGVDFWSLFGRGKEVLERKLKKPKVGTDNDPPDMKTALGTFDFLMDAFKSLYEENKMETVKFSLQDCSREIDTNVIIANELIAPLLGPEGIIVLNSHHASSSELQQLKEPSKLKVASATGIWKGLGIGHPSVWHGEVDMMVVPNGEILSGATAVVALPVAQPAGDDDDDDDDDEDEDEDEAMLHAGCIVAEGKKNSSDMGFGFSQALATAITFSFVCKAHYNHKGTLFPTIQVSRNGFEIFLYDSHTDVLLMNSFLWVPKNIAFLWAVVHYGLLMTNTTAISEDLKCGYKKCSDEFGGFTQLEGRGRLAVPIARISHYETHSGNVLLRYAGEGKLFP